LKKIFVFIEKLVLAILIAQLIKSLIGLDSNPSHSLISLYSLVNLLLYSLVLLVLNYVYDKAALISKKYEGQ
jgi:uncharacterized Tic20 family protein